jgi:hypothetical protein
MSKQNPAFAITKGGIFLSFFASTAKDKDTYLFNLLTLFCVLFHPLETPL